MAVDKRQLRKERGYVQSESRWMQKALFALGKAEAAHEKLVASQNGDGSSDPITIKIGKKSVTLDTVRDGFQDRVDSLAEILQDRSRVLR